MYKKVRRPLLDKVESISITESQSTESYTAESGKILEAETQNAVDLKRAVRIVEAVSEDTFMEVDAEGVRFKAVDSKYISVIDLQLTADFFGLFLQAQELRTAVDTGELKKAVTEANKGDRVCLEVYRRESENPVVVKVNDEEVAEISEMNLSEDDLPTVDNLEYSGSAVIELGVFKKAVKLIDETAWFELSSEGLVLEVDGGTAIGFEPHPEGPLRTTSVEDEDKVLRSLYSRKYLKPVGKLKNTVDEIEFHMGDEFPWKVNLVKNDEINLEYVVAPRIEE